MNARLRCLYGAGATLLVLVNVIVLAGVAWNRSGEAQSRLLLSERELGLPGVWRSTRENSGLALALHWRVAPGSPDAEAEYGYAHGPYAATSWLDAALLARLGFDTRPMPDGAPWRQRRQAAREVWIALELDGPAHARSVMRARGRVAEAERALAAHPGDRQHEDRVSAARSHLEQVRDHWTRLLAIDADRDRKALRARHPDRSGVAIVRARVRPSWFYPTPQRAPRQGEWRGFIEAVSVSAIHVPLAMRSVFDAQVLSADSRRQARYQVTVAWGRRGEPWIEAVSQGHP